MAIEKEEVSILDFETSKLACTIDCSLDEYTVVVTGWKDGIFYILDCITERLD